MLLYVPSDKVTITSELLRVAKSVLDKRKRGINDIDLDSLKGFLSALEDQIEEEKRNAVYKMWEKYEKEIPK